MIAILIELVASFIQYLTIIVSWKEVDFPDSWRSPFNFLNILNLHFDFLSKYIPALQDVRLYFVFISVVGPLIFVILGLIFLNPKLVVLWYLVFLIGWVLLIAGATARIVALVTDLEFSVVMADAFMIIGSIMVVAAAILALIKYQLNKNKEEAVTKQQLMEEETKKIDVADTVQRAVIILVCLIVYFTGFFGLQSSIDALRVFILVLSYACLVFAFFAFIWLVMGLIQKGRQLQWKIGHWAERSFLRILLLTMSLLYIPIGSGVFYVFNCNNFTCLPGTRLPDPNSHMIYTPAVTDDECIPCNRAAFATQRCPYSVWEMLCVHQVSYRLEYDTARNCEGMQAFFWPAALLIVIMFVLGSPILFHILIDKGSNLLIAEFPLLVEIQKRRYDEQMAERTEEKYTPAQLRRLPKIEEPAELTKEERWDKKITESRNVAKFLYQPFLAGYRYVRLVQLVQKAVIVTATMYVLRSDSVPPGYVAIITSLAVHLMGTVALLVSRPFIMKFETNIAILMEIFLSISSVMGMLLLIGLSVPDWLMLVIIILNGILPLVALILGIFLEYSRGKQSKKEEEERKRQLLEDAMVADDAQQQPDGEGGVAVQMSTSVALPPPPPAPGTDESTDAATAPQGEYRAEDEVPLTSAVTTAVPTMTAEEAFLADLGEEASSEDLDEDEGEEEGGDASGGPPPLQSPVSSESPLPEPALSIPHAVPGEEQNGGEPTAVSGSGTGTATTTEERKALYEKQTLSSPDEDHNGRTTTPSGSPDDQQQRTDASAAQAEPSVSFAEAEVVAGGEASTERRRSSGGQRVRRKSTLIGVKIQRRQTREAKARAFVEAELKAQQKELEEAQGDVDMRIDRIVKQSLNRFFMFGGVLGFVALGLCIIGLTEGESVDEFKHGDIDVEFSGYGSWNNFTQHCGCMFHYNPVGSEYYLIEKWQCINERIKERVRIQNTSAVVTSGLAIRDLCAATYKNGCTESMDYLDQEISSPPWRKNGIICPSVGVETGETITAADLDLG